jgi:hypothetical protein
MLQFLYIFICVQMRGVAPASASIDDTNRPDMNHDT